jgi:hypothetical protein
MALTAFGYLGSDIVLSDLINSAVRLIVAAAGLSGF